MSTAQDAITKLRIQLGETDSTNSRWDDTPDLLNYINQGRRAFAKDSESVKAVFQQTTTIGPTLAGQNRFARYILDPQVWEIDNIFYNDFEVESTGTQEWEENIGARDPGELGIPFTYRRLGDSVDLYLAPNEQKILEVHASVIPVDFAALTDNENELKEDQVQAAVDYATFLAMMDDDRDGTLYLDKFRANARQWKKKIHRKGSRTVNIKRDFWWLT